MNRWPRRVLCIDPGETTGWAILLQLAAHVDPVPLAAGILFPADVVQFIQKALLAHAFTDVVIEKYHGGAGGELQSLVNRIIGRVEALAEIHKIPVTFQRNAERKAMQDKANAICPSSIVHARDALAHGLTFMSRCA